MYTNIPLEETIVISVNLICNNEPDLKISPDGLRKLFQFATSQSHFTFKGDIFDQVDGVTMRSSLGPILANVFMGFHESKWIKSYRKSRPLFYTRYVNDVLKRKWIVRSFWNISIANILILSLDGKLSFLDITID